MSRSKQGVEGTKIYNEHINTPVRTATDKMNYKSLRGSRAAHEIHY